MEITCYVNCVYTLLGPARACDVCFQDAQNDAALLCIAEDVKKELSAIPSTVVKVHALSQFY